MNLLRFAVALLLLAAIATAWRWTPLHDRIALDSAVSMARRIAHSPLAPFAILAAYLVGGLVAFPITVLIAATGIVFGPLEGGLYALGGCLLNAAATYGVGCFLGRHTVRRLAGSRLDRITRRLAGKGILVVALIRLLPIAPFSMVNVVAGASRIRLRDFLLGTAIGMLPGITVTVMFVDRLSAAIIHPGPGTFVALAAVATVILGAILFAWRRFGGE
jgi:uncharacterized membrane protein YdjX (TVP38/TMEM64 family)